MEKGQLLELIIKALPYSSQITDIDLEMESDAVRFTWRGNRLRVDFNLHVEEKDGVFLKSTNLSIVVQRLLGMTKREM